MEEEDGGRPIKKIQHTIPINISSMSPIIIELLAEQFSAIINPKHDRAE